MCEYTAKDFKKGQPRVAATTFSSHLCIRQWPKLAFHRTKQQ